MLANNEVDVGRITLCFTRVELRVHTEQCENILYDAPTYEVVLALSLESKLEATLPEESCAHLALLVRVVDDGLARCYTLNLGIAGTTRSYTLGT